MPLVLAGATSGSITIDVPATAGTNTLTVPALTGTVITTASTGQNIPKAALPTGSVLQVVQGSTTSQVTIASTTFADTNLTATITPNFASSKILILISQTFFVLRLASGNGHGIRILRDASSIFDQDYGYLGGYVEISGSTNSQLAGREFVQFLDSPATTSAVTYKTQGKADASSNGGYVTYQNSTSTSVITLMEIAA